MSQPSKETPSSQPSHVREASQATPEDITKLRELVKKIGCCMLTTIDSTGVLHSRPMGVNGELEQDDNGTCLLWFYTYGSSHKVTEMNSHGHQCNLAFSDPTKQTFISISGHGHLIKDRELIKKRWNSMLNAWFPKGSDEPDAALLKIVLTKAECWDAPSSLVAHAVSFVKSKVTGTIADPGDHRKLTLEANKKGDMSAASKSATEKKEQTRDEAKMQS